MIESSFFYVVIIALLNEKINYKFKKNLENKMKCFKLLKS